MLPQKTTSDSFVYTFPKVFSCYSKFSELSSLLYSKQKKSKHHNKSIDNKVIPNFVCSVTYGDNLKDHQQWRQENAVTSNYTHEFSKQCDCYFFLNHIVVKHFQQSTSQPCQSHDLFFFFLSLFLKWKDLPENKTAVGCLNSTFKHSKEYISLSYYSLKLETYQ